MCLPAHSFDPSATGPDRPFTFHDSKQNLSLNRFTAQKLLSSEIKVGKLKKPQIRRETLIPSAMLTAHINVKTDVTAEIMQEKSDE